MCQTAEQQLLELSETNVISGILPPEFARAESEYTLSEHLSVQGQNAELISDELAMRLAVAGEPDECARRLTELAALGLDGVTITLLSGGREQRLARMAAELLPALRGQRV